MPIYEFECYGCGRIFEILQIAGKSGDGPRCPECGGEELGRVLSPVVNALGRGSTQEDSGPRLASRSCAGGSCKTVTLPGPKR